MSKHWFIAHLISKYSKNKLIGLDIGAGDDNWIEFKKCPFVNLDKNNKSNIQIDLNNKPIPYNNNSFDIVIAINSINYMNSPWDILKQTYKVLKNKGILVLVVNNKNSKNPTAHDNINTMSKKYTDSIMCNLQFKKRMSIKEKFWSWWFNKTSVYYCSVYQKITGC